MWADEFMQYAYDRGVFEGAAILFGLVGMAEELSRRDSIRACPTCLLAPSAWVGTVCMECHDLGRRYPCQGFHSFSYGPGPCMMCGFDPNTVEST